MRVFRKYAENRRYTNGTFILLIELIFMIGSTPKSPFYLLKPKTTNLSFNQPSPIMLSIILNGNNINPFC